MQIIEGDADLLKEAINNLTASENDFINNKDDFNEIYHFILASLNYQSTIRDSSLNRMFYLNIEDFVMVLRQLIDKEFIIPYPLIGNWNDKILKWELNKKKRMYLNILKILLPQLVKKWTRFDEE